MEEDKSPKFCAWCSQPIPTDLNNYGSRRYCCPECFSAAQKMRERSSACPYNDGVDCNSKTSCCRCGWNPEVAKQRLKTFLRRE